MAPPASGATTPPLTKNSSLGTSMASKEKFGADYFIFHLLPRENWLRRTCARLVTHKYFERFIIGAIVANSVILGLSDFSVVDSSLNPASQGKKWKDGVLVDAYSFQNYIVQISEIPFTTAFTTECLIKMIAMGVQGKGSYQRDGWNVLDFFVVISSLVASLPGVPNISVIRTIRVLRPLRSLSMIPGMKFLISALLKALPALGNVVILQLFVFFIFGILGIQLFGGSMNRRCRTTPFPVRLPLDDSNSSTVWPVPDDYLQQVITNPVAFQCLDAPLLGYDSNTGSFTKETSPWSTPQDCFWPVDDGDQLLCAALGQPGNHQCAEGEFCGSNYDAFGNARFRNAKAMDYALYVDNTSWGYTTFDNIGDAFFTIFQSITQEGWTNIMYMVMDSSQPIIGAIFFVALIIFASFFVMNLTLAVISEEFSIDESPRGMMEADKQAIEQQVKSEGAKRSGRGHWLTAIVSHKLFTGFIMVVIVVNTTVLSLDHYPMSSTMDANLEIANFVLSCIFVTEMAMKLFGLGLRGYAREKFNLFDAFIVMTGVLETIASPPSFMSDNPPKKGTASALRSFRLFRVFKLARDWKSLRVLLEMIGRALSGLTNFSVLLFLFIYIYALVGNQFFGNTMRFDDLGYPTPRTVEEFWDGTVPRNNFDTLHWSSITVFQIITGENWNEIMYDTIRGNGKISCIFHISLVIFGTFVLMNLFLALLLDNFGTDDEEQAKEKLEETKKLAKKMSVLSTSSMKVAPIEPSNGPRRQSIIAEVEREEDNEDEDVQVVDLDNFEDELTLSVPRRKSSDVGPLKISEGNSNQISKKVAVGGNRRRAWRDSLASGRSSRLVSSEASEVIADWQAEPDAGKVEDTVNLLGNIRYGGSLFIFSESCKVRQWARLISAHRYFDTLVFGLIIVSSIALAVDNPLADPISKQATFLKGLDKGLAVVFTIEMVIKIIAMGLVLNKGSYLRNYWNIIDGVIVISSIIMLAEESTTKDAQLKSLRSLRGLRTFRPLRMISRRPGLKLVVNALFEAIPEVINVLFVCMLFYLIFSIVAVNYLKGQLATCSGDAFDSLSDAQVDYLVSPTPWATLTNDQQSWFANTTCAGFSNGTISLTSQYVCGCWGADWEPVRAENFNNVGNAMLAFFEISTTEGWADLMMAAIDANGIGMQPIRDNNMIWAPFFVAFIMIGSFFAVNLFVGVIIDNFNRMKAALGGDFMLTPEQKKWIEAQKAASRVGPVRIMKPPQHPFRRLLFYVVNSKRFEWFITICISVNTLLMAAQYFGQSTLQAYVINVVNIFFAAVFTLEAVLKIIAFGMEYFEDQWNQFDFFVVVGTLLSIIVELFTSASIRSLAMMVRVFRVTRILRLVKASKSIRQILLTLYIALPGLSNITSILFLMLFIYATMGVQLFAKVALHNSIDTHANFQNFGKAFLFLLRAATGESWNYCMHDLATSTPGCVVDPPYDPTMCGFNDFDGCVPINGCGDSISFLFFGSFTLLVTYVMLNLTIAVILEGFSLSHEDEKPLFDPELLQEFQAKWAEIDPKATAFVKVDQMLHLVNILKPPLGRFGLPFGMIYFFKYIFQLEIPLYEGEYVHFRDVLIAMTREMVKGLTGDQGTISAMPSDQDLGSAGGMASKRRIEFFAHQYFGACRIQRQVANWLRIKRGLEKKAIEEYKLKIKKPSGRPKKIRDGRVFTTG